MATLSWSHPSRPAFVSLRRTLVRLAWLPWAGALHDDWNPCFSPSANASVVVAQLVERVAPSFTPLPARRADEPTVIN